MKSSRTFSLVYTREARKNVAKMDPSIQQVIRRALEALAINPYKGKQLSYELSGLRSFRTSDYRIIYRIKDMELIIIVISVGHRKEIYKKLKDFLE